MHLIYTLLNELDTLYTAETLGEYEEALTIVERKVQHVMPGFTIAYAQLATVGSEREQSGRMAHVLAPEGGEPR